MYAIRTDPKINRHQWIASRLRNSVISIAANRATEQPRPKQFYTRADEVPANSLTAAVSEKGNRMQGNGGRTFTQRQCRLHESYTPSTCVRVPAHMIYTEGVSPCRFQGKALAYLELSETTITSQAASVKTREIPTSVESLWHRTRL
jgi:hypothetical protein